jgi:hypothetical protein
MLHQVEAPVALSAARPSERREIVSVGTLGTGARREPFRWPRWLPGLLLTLAFAHNAALSWRKWGDLYVDVGRELELPSQILAGRLLYADLRFYYGPLGPYVNAFLYRLFGVHLDVLIGAGLVSAALMTWVLYRLARRFVNRPMATMTAGGFLYLCAFGHLSPPAIFNFVLPYTYSATYGILAATASLYFLLRHVSTGRRRDHVLSLVGFVLAALAKVEALVPALLVHAAYLAWASTSGRARRIGALTGFAAAGAIVLAVYGGFRVAVGPSLLTDNLAGVLNPGSAFYISVMMGTRRPLASLGLVALSVVLLGMTVLVVYALLTRLGPRLGPVLALAATAVTYATLPIWVSLRGMPVLVATMLASDLHRWWRGVEPGERILPRVLLLLFAGGSLSRIILFVAAAEYGFYLSAVPLVALAVLWAVYVPRWLPVVDSRRGFALASHGLFLGLIVAHLQVSYLFYAAHTVGVQAPRGRLYLISRFPSGVPWGVVHEQVLRLLGTLPAGTRVLTIPHGVGFVFFAGLAYPYRMFSYVPPEWSGGFDDARIIADWAASPPDVIVLEQGNMSAAEFGYRGFGVDHGRAASQWIEANYEPWAVIAYLRILTRRGFERPARASRGEPDPEGGRGDVVAGGDRAGAVGRSGVTTPARLESGRARRAPG